MLWYFRQFASQRWIWELVQILKFEYLRQFLAELFFQRLQNDFFYLEWNRFKSFQSSANDISIWKNGVMHLDRYFSIPN